MPTIETSEAQALELSLAKHVSRQPKVPGNLWTSLEHRGLVTRLEDEDGKSWFELTDSGCEELRAAGGTAYETGACFSCGKQYAYPSAEGWFVTTCPVCGYYAADE